jgi:putative ABC transport system ATP-binding protein
MDKILEVKNLSKVFEKRGRKVHALAKVNFDIKKGEYISIQGPSGSGKTTLLNVLGCLDKPSSGKLIIDGIKVSEMNGNSLSKIRAQKIGFIFQEFNLIPILSAVENVELPMELTEITKRKRRKKATKLLKLVGLTSRMDHLPGELSAGEQQRVAVARALANDPAIILADEPTGNLDSKTSKKIMKLLDKLNEELGTTIIVVTHDDKMALLTKKLVFIKDGKISKIKPLREGKVYEISEALDLSQKIVNVLIRAGYNDVDKIVNTSEANLKKIKKLKRKDVQNIRNRIEKYHKRHKKLNN